jgi:hypothetical protein
MRTRVRRFAIALSLATLLASVATYILVKLDADPSILVLLAVFFGAVAVAQTLNRNAGIEIPRLAAGAAKDEPAGWEERRSAYRTLQLDLLHDLDLDVGMLPHPGPPSTLEAEALAPLVAALSGALATEGAAPQVALGLAEEVQGHLRLIYASGAFTDVLRPGMDLQGVLNTTGAERGRWTEVLPLPGPGRRTIFALSDVPLEQPERELLGWYAQLFEVRDRSADRPAVDRPPTRLPRSAP